MDTKVCSKCGEDKPLADYYSNQRSLHKRASCKDCYNAMDVIDTPMRAPVVTLNPNRLEAQRQDAQRVRSTRKRRAFQRMLER